VSRRRKGAKVRKTGERVLFAVPSAELSAVPDDCDCPACLDRDPRPEDLIDDLVAGAADLLDVVDPLEAELFAAGFLAAGRLAGEGFDEAFADGIVPAVAERATRESLAALLALDAVDDGAAAGNAARRLAGAGIPAPAWADELREPVRAGECRRFADTDGGASVLVCSFTRAGRSHGFVVNVDHTDCDAAVEIAIFPEDIVDQVVATIQMEGRQEGLTITSEVLDPAEFRWQAERALDARAAHDLEDGEELELSEDLGDQEGPGYHLVAMLLRARMRALPEPARPPAPHGDGDGPFGRADLAIFAKLAEGGRSPGKGVRGGTPKLPAKRKRSDPPAPVYQIKVSLQGASPPIWRRLEVPADIGLADLHHALQAAFDWEDSHLHVFETAHGSFGVADRELGHRAEAPVTLEQVAGGAGDRLRYTYDFGDDWTHQIVVEKVLDRQPVAYPRCTGGRRAAPPEDCGGIWGYTELVEILGDPGHPEHRDRLEWLGLDSAAGFRPGDFDAAAITRRLTRPR
jgi:hypothetical protein